MTGRNASGGGAQPQQVVVRADWPEVRSRAPHPAGRAPRPCRQSQSSDTRAGQEEVVPAAGGGSRGGWWAGAEGRADACC